MSAQPASLDERRAILQKEIAGHLSRGFRVLSQTDTTAQLLKPKKFSLLWALLWFFVFGVGLLLYLLYYLSKKDETVYLEVDESGRVKRVGPGGSAGLRLFGLTSTGTLILCGGIMFLCVIVGLGNNRDGTTSATPSSVHPTSNTPRPTSTRGPTSTATSTFTPLPPGTQTAEALAVAQTDQASKATTSQQAIYAERTSVAQAATSTREALILQRTQSARSTATYQALLAEYERVDIQDIVSYPGSYAGDRVIVRAEVDEIRADGTEVTLWLYSWAGSGFTTAYMRLALSPESGVLEGYTYLVYGTVGDCRTFEFYTLDGYCLNDAFIPQN